MSALGISLNHSFTFETEILTEPEAHQLTELTGQQVTGILLSPYL